MTEPKISYIEITARTDFPVVGRPEMHLWEPTLRTLQNQDFKDFEYIVVDVFYHERPNYFKDHNYGLRIKHIPATPNIWSELGLVQTCHQFNKGLVYADGKLVLFGADSAMYPPWLMGELWRHYMEGWFISLGFGADITFSPDLKERMLGNDGQYKFVDEWQGQRPEKTRTGLVDTYWYRDLGYEGIVTMDHRYRNLFTTGPSNFSMIPPSWFYGISTLSMSAALKVNGMSLNFDGDSALNDVDLGWRLKMAGFEQIAMCRKCYTIEAYAGTFWHPKMMSPRPEVKCNYAMVNWNKMKGKYRANDGMNTMEVDEMIGKICGDQGICDVKNVCRTLPHRGPFFNKQVPNLYEHWLKHGAPERFDLALERDMRKAGVSHRDGTFVNMEE
jgi:hypothetical protein